MIVDFHAHCFPDKLFGTDLPWSGVENELSFVKSLGLSESELEDVLGGNAEKLLGITG